MADEHYCEEKELCAGEMRVVRGHGAFGHIGEPRDLLSGVRREGQRLRDATGAGVPAMRRRRAARRKAFVPDVYGHGLVTYSLNLRTRDASRCLVKQSQRPDQETEMREYRHECGGGLRLWDMRCPYCHQSTLNWPHVLAITVVAALAVFYLLRVF